MEKIDGVILTWENHTTGEGTRIKPQNDDFNQFLGSIQEELNCGDLLS